MKAKFIYESFNKILSPKPTENIIKELYNLNPNDLLVKSARSGFIDGVEIALDRGGDIHTHSDEALRSASINNNYDIVKLLLDMGANVHAENDAALRNASLYGYIEVIKLLLDRGANVHAKEDEALTWALEGNYYDAAKLLLDRGATYHHINMHLPDKVVKLLKKYKK